MRSARFLSSRRRRGSVSARLVAVVALGSLVAACGSSNGSAEAASGTTAVAKAAATTIQKNGEKSMSKPVVSVPAGEAPTSLVKDDLVVGTGAEAVKGRTVSVHYVGVQFSDGKQFDASWDRNEPFVFRLGAGQVIGGWDQGVEGMKVGGRRQLVIPPALGYGSRGAPPVIGPNATLVFVVDLLGVQ